MKGLALVHPEQVELGPTGALANRRYFLVTAEGRLLNGKAHGPLVQVAARSSGDGVLELAFPGGDIVTGEVTLGERVVTDFFGDPVDGRVVLGPWSDALSSFVGRPIRLIRVESEERDGSDRGRRGSVSIVSVASLERLAGEAGVEAVDGRRFRMLFTIAGVDAHDEDTWLGRDVAIGEAVVRPNGLAGRCAVTTYDPDSGLATLDTLRVLRAYRSDVPTGEPLPFGVFGEVVRPGVVAVGDSVSPA